MPKVEGLPEEAEATVDLTLHQIQYLKVAYDLLKEPIAQIIATQSPDWLITDFASFWVSSIVEKYGVRHMYFSVFNAATYSFLGAKEFLAGEQQRKIWPNPESMTKKPQWIPFESSVAYRGYEARGLHAGFFGQNASGTTDGERVARTLQASQAVAIRSCREFEGEYIDLYERLMGKHVVPVGLLPPVQEDKTETLDEPWSEVFGWLDEQSERSVVFVGFGSEYKLSKEEVYEIAYGLEMSRLPFLWSLRSPMWAADDAEALPQGFGERVCGRGVVRLGWAPQHKILAHPSVGGSLFHSGWGSVIESLQYGHVLVALPFIIDQGLNARLLVDKDLAIEVERGEDGSFVRDDIARALRRAMVEEEGERIRVCARKAADVFGNPKLNQGYINGLIKYMALI